VPLEIGSLLNLLKDKKESEEVRNLEIRESFCRWLKMINTIAEASLLMSISLFRK
jgi:hypothetical protein